MCAHESMCEGVCVSECVTRENNPINSFLSGKVADNEIYITDWGIAQRIHLALHTRHSCFAGARYSSVSQSLSIFTTPSLHRFTALSSPLAHVQQHPLQWATAVITIKNMILSLDRLSV